jgi:hypothetical protein
MKIAPLTTSYTVEDHSWLGSAHGTDSTETITLDVSAFTEGTHYPNGYIPSGTPLAKITSSGLFGPYGASPSEVQTLTFDATGGTYTVAFDGSAATGNITYLNTSGDTAAITAALESLSTINPGDVTVTRGTPAGNVTIFTVTFGGDYVGENIPEIVVTESLTGGSGTLVVATSQAGGGAGTGGLEIGVGHLYTSTEVDPNTTTTDVGAALLTHGKVREANLPIAVDAAFKADVAGRIRYI